MIEPNDTHISNHLRDDYWTTPCCYADVGNVGEGQHKCPDCGRAYDATIEMEPACHARLVEESDDA